MSGYSELVGQFINRGTGEGTKETHHSLGQSQGNHSDTSRGAHLGS